MKKLVLIFTVCAFAACNGDKKEPSKDDRLSTDLVNNPVSAEGTDPKDLANMPTMDFTDTMHNFGTLHEGEVVTYDFEFKNNGKTPLLISGATGSCGCTAPDYSHDPIKPGETGVMKVKFNSEGKQHHQEKSVTINTNSNKGTHMLYIKADVVPKENPDEISTTISNKK